MYGTDKIIGVERIGEAVVVTPGRDLSDRDGARIEREFAVLADDPAVRRVVVDFHRTCSVGPTVVNVLARLGHAARHRGGRLALCNLPSDEQQTLEAVGLAGAWPVYYSLPEAVQAIA